jgi:hypothetical protein
MTQEPSDDRSESEHDDGARGRHSDRVTILGRASTAVRRAHATAEQAAAARAVAGEVYREALENRSLREIERDSRAEREARDELEALVRRFAALLRADGAPPETAVRRLKTVVAPAIFTPRDRDGVEVEWRRGVASDVVKWFVEAYYAA